MPYIKDADRTQYKKSIEKLAELVTANPSPGELNYILSKLLWTIFDKKPSYTLGNNLMGVLECVKVEFYRRKLAPYEDAKIQENGDI
jgi:hypothetical protein